ncbi:hypothetical protein PARPLA_02948 [Rhodobacteraceae bacterium THAF1]|uniref:DUF5337 domain-containing protein n=1 Tax=Palleronia sp. THAF1 TaxID=2587842 RepID=UPI000F41E0C1|nr:DUF5337 domain-containing protein [Palleronia sp. THAF1]QFU08349.1 hypothetical protein FIU81_06650 [Palleronia sp. THAF1]VDC29019.1 hypothetical protein PARPLA_02948 [Rhodobacteraceae bacterium THAF1]
MAKDDLKTGKQARNIGVIMAMTMIMWMGLQLTGSALGLPQQLVFIVDIAALAVFVWALVATFRIWQKRRDDAK